MFLVCVCVCSFRQRRRRQEVLRKMGDLNRCPFLHSTSLSPLTVRLSSPSDAWSLSQCAERVCFPSDLSLFRSRWCVFLALFEVLSLSRRGSPLALRASFASLVASFLFSSGRKTTADDKKTRTHTNTHNRHLHLHLHTNTRAHIHTHPHTYKHTHTAHAPPPRITHAHTYKHTSTAHAPPPRIHTQAHTPTSTHPLHTHHPHTSTHTHTRTYRR